MDANPVAVFKLAHRAEIVTVAHEPPQAPLHRAAPAIDRRGPNRAKNVVRPGFGTRKAKPDVAASPASAGSAKTGTDDDWSSF